MLEVAVPEVRRAQRIAHLYRAMAGLVAEVQRIARPYWAGEGRQQGAQDSWVVWLAPRVLQVLLLREAAMAARNDQPLLDHRSWHRLADADQREQPTLERSRHADQPP